MIKFLQWVNQRSKWDTCLADNSEYIWPSIDHPYFYALDGVAALSVWIFGLVLITADRWKDGTKWSIDWRPD